MFDQLVQRVIETLRSPRQGARWAIDTLVDAERIALMFGLAFAVSATLVTVRALLMGDELSGEMGVISFLIGNLVVSTLTFAFMVIVIFAVGRLFGGKGEVMEVAAAFAWHSFVTAIFAPFASPAALMQPDPGPALAVALVLMGVTLWLLVNFVAEVHRFASAWRVAAVMFGGLFLIGLIVPFFFAGAMSGS